MAVTDSQLLHEVQFHVIEPPNQGQIMTSEIWTISEVIGYLNDRLRRFIAETKVSLTHSTLPTIPGVNRYDLNTVSDGIVDLARVAWLDIDGVSYELERAEALRYDLLRSTWETTPDTPVGYSIVLQPNMTLDLMPAPISAGELDLLYTGLGTSLSNTGVTIPLPDDLAPHIKWGVMADMLKKDGLGHDAERAMYCEGRYQEGIELAKMLLGSF